ncbi:hypothetical protein RB3668 [Rhodopirellula baltica SH 1]|uniref:Uncharacterized protein n=1 Tax=Rhodopirellula baltica (strain DSM 10527 / NCIMB 13988 / SH1) TaxID=243090 RepID=Q7UTV0_RHOBA|nr:hypothetical protein RB3668 [Rhodopirellula baltica SH 1]
MRGSQGEGRHQTTFQTIGRFPIPAEPATQRRHSSAAISHPADALRKPMDPVRSTSS